MTSAELVEEMARCMKPNAFKKFDKGRPAISKDSYALLIDEREFEEAARIVKIARKDAASAFEVICRHFELPISQ